MRTIKELLELMLDNRRYFSGGLCRWVKELWTIGIIDRNEKKKIEILISLHRPSKFSSIKAFKNRNSIFYWPVNDIRPRIKWLQKHIKKNS